MGGIAPLDPGLRAEPLFTTHLWAKTSIGGLRGAPPPYLWGQNFLWGSKGGSAPLKEKTAHMECTRWHVGLSKGAKPP